MRPSTMPVFRFCRGHKSGLAQVDYGAFYGNLGLIQLASCQKRPLKLDFQFQLQGALVAPSLQSTTLPKPKHYTLY